VAGKTKPTQYFYTSPKRLYLLTLITFGWYDIFWMYRNWKAIRTAKQIFIMPFWRSVFSLFFIESLFRHIRDDSKRADYPKPYSSSWSAAIYILGAIVSGLVGLVGNFIIAADSNTDSITKLGQHAGLYYGLCAVSIILLACSMYPLYKSQKAINYYLDKVSPSTKNQPRTGGEIAMIIVGLLFSAFTLYGIFFPNTSSQTVTGPNAATTEGLADNSAAIAQAQGQRETNSNDTLNSYDHWATYTSKQYGFSVKYPALAGTNNDWKYYEQSSSNPTGTPPQKQAISFVESSGQRYPASVQIEVYDANLAKATAFYDAYFAGQPDLATSKDTATLNGVQTTVFTYSGNGDGNTMYLVPHGNVTIAIKSESNQNVGLDKSPEYGNIFDLMAASFEIK
jgi:hypothetical protein